VSRGRGLATSPGRWDGGGGRVGESIRGEDCWAVKPGGLLSEGARRGAWALRNAGDRVRLTRYCTSSNGPVVGRTDNARGLEIAGAVDKLCSRRVARSLSWLCTLRRLAQS
jgi:hypothetical protein